MVLKLALLNVCPFENISLNRTRYLGEMLFNSSGGINGPKDTKGEVWSLEKGQSLEEHYYFTNIASIMNSSRII